MSAMVIQCLVQLCIFEIMGVFVYFLNIRKFTTKVETIFLFIETSFHSKGAFNLQIICGNFNQKDHLIWIHISFQTR